MSTNNGMTRRFFAKAAAGASAAIATASATGAAISDTVMHKVLRRPYVQIRTCEAKSYKLFDCLTLKVTAHAPVRVKAEFEGDQEAVLELTTVPNAAPLRLLGVHSTRAERPMKITLSSKKPFKIHQLDAVYMNPSFKRVDGMLIFNDPFYKPIQDGVGVGVQDYRISRLKPGVDVSYGQSPVKALEQSVINVSTPDDDD